MQLTFFFLLQITNLSRENRVLMVKLKKVGKTGHMESENGSEVSPKSEQSSLPCPQESKPQATVTSLTDQEVNQSVSAGI